MQFLLPPAPKRLLLHSVFSSVLLLLLAFQSRVVGQVVEAVHLGGGGGEAP